MNKYEKSIRQYFAAMVNITNRCTLRCRHCFVYRDGNPNDRKDESVTDNCPSKEHVLPLYLEGGEFVIPYCCYGNDVDCDLCGAWVVFHLAAKLEEGGMVR